jgi:hypothetical protein
MAQDAEALLLYLDANLRRFERSMNKAAGIADQKFNAIERRQREADKKLAAFGSQLGDGLGRASLVAGAALGAIGLYAVELAKDAEETKNAFNVAFGDSAKAAEAFANTLSGKVGRDVIELQGNMAQLRLVLDGLGVSGEQSLQVVQALTARAVDIGSLFNVADADAYRAIISGISGETEPLKRFGVVLNEAALKTELLRLGFKGTVQEASEATKAIARTNIILERTGKAAGDAERTIDSLANQQKVARAEFNEAARNLGTALIPAMTKATEAAADLASTIGAMPTSLQMAGLGMLALVAAGGPIMSLITGFLRVRTAALEAAAAAAIGGAGGAAKVGAAGLATRFGVAGIGAAVVGGLALNERSGSKRVATTLRAPMLASDEDLKFTQGQIQQRRDAVAERYRNRPDAMPKATRQGLEKYTDQLSKLSAERGRREVNAEKPMFGTGTPITLNSELLKPIGGGKGGGGPKGKSAETLAKEAVAKAAKAAREAERRREEQEARERALDDQLAGLASQEIAAREAAVRTADERYEISRERAAFEAEQFDKDIERKLKDKEIDDAQAHTLRQAFVRVQVQEAANAQAELSRDIEERIAVEREEIFRLASDALGVEASMATTLQQRADVERRILALAQQEERERLEQQIARGEVYSPEAARYNLGTQQAGQRAAQGFQQGRDAEVQRLGGFDPVQAAQGAVAGVRSQLTQAEQYEAQLAEIEKMRQGDLANTATYEQAKAQIEAQYSAQRLEGASNFFGALAGLSQSSNKKLAAIGKAAALAQATINGYLAVSEAIASAPFPANLPAIAQATVASAIQIAGIAGVAGFEKGGFTGPGRKRIRGVVHGDEYVVNAQNTAKHRRELEHLERTGSLPGFERGGFVMPRAPRLPSARASDARAVGLNVAVNNYGAPAPRRGPA